jgi:TRAP transporter TAXI family solute receptor
MLQTGKLDIALVQGEVVHTVLSGSGKSPADLKIIAAMYSAPGMFVVRADSPCRSIRDLVGKPVAFGARGSGLVILARLVLDGMGLDQDRDFRAIYLDQAGDGPPMVGDGRAAALWGGGIGWPGFETVARAPGGARFLAPEEDDIQRIIEKHPFLQRLIIPAGTYPGQDSPITSVGSWSFVLARPALPDDVAYRLARALHRAAPVLGARLPQARETTMANTVAASPRQDMIHPGVLRYLREIGLLR